MQDMHICLAERFLMDSEAQTAFLDTLADAASRSIMPHFRANLAIEDKGRDGFDPVTAADRDAEAAMRKLIQANFPDHGIVGEEYGPEREDADFVWVLDPIDGTRSFISGLPVWGTLIGLLKEGLPILGMMAQPFTGERYTGDGNRAWYSGPGGARSLSSRSCPALGEASLFTTSPTLFNQADRAAYDRIESAARFARYGLDCYAYCMIAAGHGDVVIETELQAYDIVGLIPIIEGAGGRVTSWSGGSPAAGGSIVAAGDHHLHATILDLLSES
jgi:histidinol phosphatase-like enzyme (inositol monophosphatase family)